MKTEERDPILVNNPHRNVLMNVEPFFFLMHVYQPVEAFDFADMGIKFMALCDAPDWMDNDERQAVICFLYEVRDLFARMKECQITLPKKGGAV